MLDHPVQNHLPSVAQLVISIAGLVFSIFSLLAIAALISVTGSAPNSTILEIQSLETLIWISGALALITLPSLIFSVRRLTHKSIPQKSPRGLFMASSLSLVALVPLTFLGSYLSSNQFPSAVKGVLTILSVAIPLWWIVELGRAQLQTGSPQRQWGLVNFGVFVTLPFVIFIEFILVAIGIGFAIMWLVQQPEFTPMFMQLQTQLKISPNEFPRILEQLKPILQKPGVIAAGFFGVSVLIPMMEELFKPLALWFFIKHNWSPAEGFTAGLLSGAAFALVESLTSLSAVPNEAWTVTVIGRVGTGLLHILTAGLTGWALTASWRDGKYQRIGFIFLASVGIHGLWNFFALLSGFGPSLNEQNTSYFESLTLISPWVMAVITVWMLTLLFAMNRKLRALPIPSEIPALPCETIE